MATSSRKKALSPASEVVPPHPGGTESMSQVHSPKSLAAKPRCIQCGKELRNIPFVLNNIVCRACDGAERGRKTIAPLTLPDKQLEVSLSDEEADAPTS